MYTYLYQLAGVSAHSNKMQNIDIIGRKQKEFYFDIGRNLMQRRSSSTPPTLMLDLVQDGRRISP